jgi:serine phosphatase RsbU (regulator of sigma subunit)
MIYCLFIILSTLRLRPALCFLSGAVCAAGYIWAFYFTTLVAPQNDARHEMPPETYIYFPILLLLAGITAAAVARQIRQHVIAALAEAETRRKLDRIEYDLRTARAIQMGLLPKGPPMVPGYDIAGFSEPAEHTGGDYYDWIQLPDGKIIFTIADATGHGIGPALLIAACRAYFRAIAQRSDPLEQITAQVDTLIAADVPEGRFITAAIALLDPKANQLNLYSAGQAPIYLYTRAADRVERFDANQPPLGTRYNGNGEGDGEDSSRARVISLSSGDLLVLVTDGFFECTSPAGQQLGISRLADSIRAHRSLPADDLIRHLHQDVQAFSQTIAQADDLTAVVIKRN